MTVTVPIDLDVVGGGLSDAIEDDLRDARRAAGRAGSAAGDAFGDGFERQASSATREVEALLTEATRTRTADIEVDVDGTGELAALDAAIRSVEGTHVARVEIETDRNSDMFENITRSATRNASGVSEAFSGAFQLVARNAIILGVAVAAAFAALPAIGAAAATATVLAFGAGIAGIGIVAAAQSKEVQSAFKDMAKDIVSEVKRISAPFEDVLINLTGDIRDAFDFFAPALEVAFRKMAPVLNSFNDQFFKAFGDLSGAIVPITDAFNVLLGAIGPKMEGFFSKLSASFIKLSDVISSDPELFASLFVGILNVIPGVISAVATLAEAFKVIVDVAKSELKPAWDELVAALNPLTSALSGSTSGMDIFKATVLAVATNLRIIINVITITVKQTQLVARAFVAVGRAIAATWRNTQTVTTAVFARIRAAITSAVAAIRGTVTRGVAAVRTAFAVGFAAARAVVNAAMAAIRAAVTGAIGRITGSVRSGLGAVRSAFSSGFAAARSTVVAAMARIRSAVSSGIGNVIAVVRGLPGRIRGALGSLGTTLYSAGVSLINGFASGIRAAIGNAVSAASSAVSAVRGFFPFSPAKEGPFSGTGYTTYSGEALMKDFAKSMEETADAVAPQVAAALDPFAAAVPSVVPRQPSSAAPAAAAAGGSGADAASLAAMFSRLTLNVSLGRDRRTTAEWWLDGQQLAANLG